MSYLDQSLAWAELLYCPPDGETDETLEDLAECAYRAANDQPNRLQHVASYDVPRLLREIQRLRGKL